MTGDGAGQNRERLDRLAFDTLATRSLARVAAALADAGVRPVPVKGVVLARWLYDDVTDRPYVDVDLLVPRASFARAVHVAIQRGWPVWYRAEELGEALFVVDHVAVELHAEIGRRDLSRLRVEDVIDRAVPDAQTFAYEILRIDDVDHFLLLLTNVVKDGFTYANPHQPEDLERLLRRLDSRLPELFERTRAAGFLTALHNVSAWMIGQHGSPTFRRLAPQLPAIGRRAFRAAVHLHWSLERRRANRLAEPSALIGLALATLTPDDWPLRARGLARLVRRGWQRRRNGTWTRSDP